MATSLRRFSRVVHRPDPALGRRSDDESMSWRDDVRMPALRQPLPARTSPRLRGVHVASGILCRRWKAAILWLLASGCRRYSQLAPRLPGITPKVLAQHLRELEREGLIDRREIPDGRKRVEYTLTPLGEGLRPLLNELERWGIEYERIRS